MRNLARTLIEILLPCLLLAGVSRAAPQQVDIAKSGATSLRAVLGKQIVLIAFHTARVKKSDPGFPFALDNYTEVSIIQSMSIVVDGKCVWVPRSVYADSFDVRQALLKFENGAFLLSMVGSDGADIYWIHIHFDAKRVIKRRVYDAFDSRETFSEETVYAPPKEIR